MFTKEMMTRISPEFAKIRSESSGTMNRNDFLSILKENCSQETFSPGTEFDTPLNRESLMLLARVIQMRMNRQILNTFTDSHPADNLQIPALLMKSRQHQITMPENQCTKIQTIRSDSDIEAIIDKAARTCHIDPDLIRSVIKAESDFNREALSPKGAMGLMQLMPETARELGVQNPYDPEENIMGGAKYLKKLLERYEGRIDPALAAYNWGMGNLERNPDDLPLETTGYIKRVKELYSEIKASGKRG